MDKTQIRSLQLYKTFDGNWIFSYTHPTTKQEIQETNTETIQGAIQSLLDFCEQIKTQEQKEREVVEHQLDLALIYVTENTTDREKQQLVEMYPSFNPELQYSKDQAVPYVKYNGKLYRITGENFKARIGETPDTSQNFEEVGKEERIATWEKPKRGTKGYSMNDVVLHHGKMYVSLINNNFEEPSPSSRVWELIGE